MTVDQILLQEIKGSELWLSREKDECDYLLVSRRYNLCLIIVSTEYFTHFWTVYFIFRLNRIKFKVTPIAFADAITMSPFMIP